MRKQVRVAAQIAGVLLITLGAANGFLATKLETCTMNAADSMLGGFLNLPLYALGFAAIIVWPLSRWAWFSLAPALLGFGYHLIWTVHFAYHYLAINGGVCDLIAGGEPWGLEGREPMYLSLWIVLSAMISAGMIWAARRTWAR